MGQHIDHDTLAVPENLERPIKYLDVFGPAQQCGACGPVNQLAVVQTHRVKGGLTGKNRIERNS